MLEPGDVYRDKAKESLAGAVSGAGGHWPVFDERSDPSVVRQVSDLSCVSACGEMLLKDRGINTVSQSDLVAILGVPAITLQLAVALNRFSPGGGWRGDYLDVPAMGGEKAIAILSHSGSWVAAMREFGAKIDHAIVIDRVGSDGAVQVRDPFAATTYTMTSPDFLHYWTWAAVWQDRSREGDL